MAKFWWQERADGIGLAQSLEVEKLHEEQSDLQKIEIFEHPAFGRILALDGYIQATQADEFIYHEMAMHVPLLGRARETARVLIIGGGDGGALREALVHDFVSEVTMVEIDRRVVELSNQYLGVQGDYDDPRATLLIEDGMRAVQRFHAEGRQFDVILLDLTEPVGPSSVLFTEAFLKILSEIVSHSGVIVDSDSFFLTTDGGKFLQEASGGGENLVNVMRRSKLLPHFDMCETNVPLYPGGHFGFFFYSHEAQRLNEPVREHQGRHYSPDIHRAAFVLPKWQRDWLGLDAKV